MAGGRSVRVITLGDPNDVACMDNGIQVVTLDDPPRAASSRRGQFPLYSGAPRRHSSVTKLYYGPPEMIGLTAPPEQKCKGSRLDWKLTPEGGLEVKVGPPLTRDEEEQKERERKEKESKAGKDTKDAKDAKDAAAAKPSDSKTSTATLKKSLCDPISLLANKRLPICFETTLGQETQGLSSVTVVNQQLNNPVAVQPRSAACVPSGGSGSSGMQTICKTESYGGPYQASIVSQCKGMGGGGGSHTTVRVGPGSSSSSMSGRCEPLLPGPCSTGPIDGRQVLRIAEEDDDEPTLRVVRIYPDQVARSRSYRRPEGERRAVAARVVHIQEDCSDYL